MNKIPNRQAICEVLMDKAKEDKDIMVLCSDSRGSASMTPFADNFPDQFIEHGSVIELKKKYGLDPESITQKILSWEDEDRKA